MPASSNVLPTGDRAGDGYASVDMALWDGDTLVAYATQTSFFTFLTGG